MTRVENQASITWWTVCLSIALNMVSVFSQWLSIYMQIRKHSTNLMFCNKHGLLLEALFNVEFQTISIPFTRKKGICFFYTPLQPHTPLKKFQLFGNSWYTTYCMRLQIKNMLYVCMYVHVDLFSLHACMSFHKILIMHTYAHECKCIGQHLKERVLWGTNKSSEKGK